jgi:hypothetical protein
MDKIPASAGTLYWFRTLSMKGNTAVETLFSAHNSRFLFDIFLSGGMFSVTTNNSGF